VVYTSVDQIYSQPLLEAYARSTGVEVLPVFDVEATKTTGLVQRLIAEADRPRADIFWNNEIAQTLLLAEKGLLASYRSPMAADLPAEHVDPGGLWTGVGCRLRVILVTGPANDDDAIDPPSSVTELAGRARAGQRIGIAYPMFGTTATHAAAIYAARGREAGRAFFTELRDSGVRLLDGNSVVRDLVVSGQLDAGLTDSDDACRATMAGKPVQIVIPDQDGAGTLQIPGSVAMIAGAPHPQQARRLIDHLVSAEVERCLIEAGCFQLSLRPGGPRSPCLPPGPIRSLDLGPEQIFRQLQTSRRDLTEILVR
jgi:iron(III) transport system substrate-binding protein